MSDARSLTPLTQADYDAIEAAVMETSRGRWFMAEYAKRNRQADTLQLLGAIGRIERVVGLGVQETSRDASLIEAAALISDLRVDLERISGKSQERASGLAAQIETAAGRILGATENIQEAAWALREAGAAEDELCDQLDRQAADISQAIGLVDGVVQRIDKIADTIAMLDSSLRAFGEITRDPSSHYLTATELAGMAPRSASAAGDDAPGHFDKPVAAASTDPSRQHSLDDTANAEKRIGSIELLDDDIVFSQGGTGGPPPARMQAAAAPSETGLREIDALPAERKLAYFV